MSERRCAKCGETYTEEFFRQTRCGKYEGHKSLRRPVCRGCELTARTEAKERNRFVIKAATAITHHAHTMVRQGKIASRRDLVEVYGWNQQQMAHDIEHAYGNGCPYCRRPFKSMPDGLGGLGGVTLDIIDPSLPPYYRTNARWVCMTCNREKNRLAPDQFETNLQCWQRWERRREGLEKDPWLGTLFEGSVRRGTRQLQFGEAS